MQNTNNEKKSKFPKTILIILLTVMASLVMMVCGYFIINRIVSDDAPPSENSQQKENQATSAVQADTSQTSADKMLENGGIKIWYEPNVEDPSKITQEEMDVAEVIIRTRLDSRGYTEAHISRQDNLIVVVIPGTMEPEEVLANIGATAKLEFLNADGEVILDGSKKYISGAKAMYGPTYEGGEDLHYVQLTFTKEGRKKFKEATQAAVTAGGDMQYITIALDGNPQMSPHVNEVIDSETCIITGDYTAEEAKNVADLINAGDLPFSLTAVEVRSIEPKP